ncbi:MAG: T9SS type A sorting domain-containing protein [Bacteroidia bacterium]|nr:T9SS type A sorting domain-containing protein [Bacteroidia bacterium]
MKKQFTLLCFFFLIFSISNAQVIPADRFTDWSGAGYPDSIPEPTLILDVTTFGAVGDGVTDNFSAVNSAINALNGAQGVIYFPAGDYLISTTLNLPDSAILRGAGSDSTHLRFNLNGAVGNAINIQGSASVNVLSVLSGFEVGSNYLVVSDASTLNPGDYMELMEANGNWDTQPVSWAAHSVGQILHLSSVSADTIYFDKPLRITYDSTLNIQIKKIDPAREVGIECLNISREDSVHAGVCINIYFNYAVNCWIRGIESSKSIGSHIEADASSNIEITGSYIHHCFEYDGTSTHGYGITLFNHTGQCKVENNIMRHLRHSFSMQCGANGNVIAYNYSLEPNRSEFPANYGADISMHGHYTFANLFESNIVQNLQIDQTWGPTGPRNTFFRNRIDLYGLLMSSGTVESDSQNFVGNEITNTNAFMGNYALTGSDHFEYGNNVKGTTTPAGTSSLSDSSYYLTAEPAFWMGTSIWPSIGYPNTISSSSIPAKDRFTSGSNFTVCHQDVTTSIGEISFTNSNISVFPNPVTNELNIFIPETTNENAKIQVLDLCGKIIHSSNQKLHSGQTTIADFNTKPGIYFLSISTSTNKVILRFSKN